MRASLTQRDSNNKTSRNRTDADYGKRYVPSFHGASLPLPSTTSNQNLPFALRAGDRRNDYVERHESFDGWGCPTTNCVWPTHPGLRPDAPHPRLTGSRCAT